MLGLRSGNLLLYIANRSLVVWTSHPRQQKSSCRSNVGTSSRRTLQCYESRTGHCDCYAPAPFFNQYAQDKRHTLTGHRCCAIAGTSSTIYIFRQSAWLRIRRGHRYMTNLATFVILRFETSVGGEDCKAICCLRYTRVKGISRRACTWEGVCHLLGTWPLPGLLCLPKFRVHMPHTISACFLSIHILKKSLHLAASLSFNSCCRILTCIKSFYF